MRLQGYWGPDQKLYKGGASLYPGKDEGAAAGGWCGGERGVKQFAERGENVADMEPQGDSDKVVGIAFVVTFATLIGISLQFVS